MPTRLCINASTMENFDYALYEEETYITLILRDGKVYIIEKKQRTFQNADDFELNPNVLYECFGKPILWSDIKDKMLQKVVFNLLII